MKNPLIRSWMTRRPPLEYHGDEDATRLAAAFAQIADAEYIQSCIDAKTLLDRVGGQVFIGAPRVKFNSEGQPIEEGAGDYQTVAYYFNYSARLDPAIAQSARAELEQAEAENAPAPPAAPEPAQSESEEELVGVGANGDGNGDPPS